MMKSKEENDKKAIDMMEYYKDVELVPELNPETSIEIKKWAYEVKILSPYTTADWVRILESGKNKNNLRREFEQGGFFFGMNNIVNWAIEDGETIPTRHLTFREIDKKIMPAIMYGLNDDLKDLVDLSFKALKEINAQYNLIVQINNPLIKSK